MKWQVSVRWGYLLEGRSLLTTRVAVFRIRRRVYIFLFLAWRAACARLVNFSFGETSREAFLSPVKSVNHTVVGGLRSIFRRTPVLSSFSRSPRVLSWREARPGVGRILSTGSWMIPKWRRIRPRIWTRIDFSNPRNTLAWIHFGSGALFSWEYTVAPLQKKSYASCICMRNVL